jgi:hypothetical protein
LDERCALSGYQAHITVSRLCFDVLKGEGKLSVNKCMNLLPNFQLIIPKHPSCSIELCQS